MNFDPSEHMQQPGQGPTLPVFEETLQVKVAGAHNNGAFEVVEISSPPESGPPLHSHRRQNEFFYVLEGTFTVRIGNDTLEAGPGTSILLPREIAHTYQNTGDETGRILAMIAPAGGVPMFEALSELSMPPDPDTVADVLDDHGVTLEGPPMGE